MPAAAGLCVLLIVLSCERVAGLGGLTDARARSGEGGAPAGGAGEPLPGGGVGGESEGRNGMAGEPLSRAGQGGAADAGGAENGGGPEVLNGGSNGGEPTCTLDSSTLDECYLE